MNYDATAANLRLQAHITLQAGEREKGKSQLVQAAQLFRHGDRAWEAQTLLELAGVDKAAGDDEACYAHAFEALTVAAEAGDRLRVHLAERFLGELDAPGSSFRAAA